MSSLRNGSVSGIASTGRLWAITTYFDPVGTRRRLPLYREFRNRLKVPLIAVELTFNDHFDLTPDDAEILIQVRGGAVLWQKERLLNLALAALPESCDTVAWIDSDVIFVDPDWPAAAQRLLHRFALVQPFSRLHYLGPNDSPRVQVPPADHFDSLAFSAAQGSLPAGAFRVGRRIQDVRYATGMAWVARRDTIQRHGFYDAAIIGGGDKLIVGAASGRYREAASRMSPRQQQHYQAWAKPLYDSVQGQISYVDGDLLHLWHGDLTDRRYVERQDGFERFHFDPDRDIKRNADGVWQWNSDKPELHAYVRKYFESLESPCKPAPVIH